MDVDWGFSTSAIETENLVAITPEDDPADVYGIGAAEKEWRPATLAGAANRVTIMNPDLVKKGDFVIVRATDGDDYSFQLGDIPVPMWMFRVSLVLAIDFARWQGTCYELC